jgi:stage II sporulation protein GA (sporulation sigma-E factor processing peptidase)
MVVYLDRVFLLNLLLDYLLLLAAAQLSGRTLHRLRLLACAAGGGAYAVLTFLPGCGFLRTPLCQLAVGSIIALCAYGGRGRPALLFLLLSGGLAGFVLALGLWAGSPTGLLGRVYRGEVSWPLLLGAALGFYVLLRLLLGQGARHGGGELLKITISVCGRKQTVTALHDTGNTLRDPVSGRPALVLERNAAEELWPPEVAAVLASPLPPEEKMARLHRQGAAVTFSLLPFRSVGTPAGLLLAARSDYIEINGRRYPRTPVALSEHPVSDGGGYHALWGDPEGEEVKGCADSTAAPSADASVQTPQAG